MQATRRALFRWFAAAAAVVVGGGKAAGRAIRRESPNRLPVMAGRFDDSHVWRPAEHYFEFDLPLTWPNQEAARILQAGEYFRFAAYGPDAGGGLTAVVLSSELLADRWRLRARAVGYDPSPERVRHMVALGCDSWRQNVSVSLQSPDWADPAFAPFL